MLLHPAEVGVFLKVAKSSRNRNRHMKHVILTEDLADDLPELKDCLKFITSDMTRGKTL